MQPVGLKDVRGGIMKSLRLTSLVTLMLAVACGSSMRPAESPKSEAVTTAPQRLAAQPHDASATAARVATLETADAAGVDRESATAPTPPPPGSASTPTGATVGAAAQPAPSTEQASPVSPSQPMMDIEAKLAIEVKDVAISLNEVRSLVAASGGQILEESIEDSKRERPSARMTARVPSSGAFDFLARLEATGVVRSRQMSSRDVGKQYFDATLRVKSLDQVLARYYDLLNKANSIEETMRVEEHIARISGEIESIKGELRWLKDRVARATTRSHSRSQTLSGSACSGRLGLAWRCWQSLWPRSGDLVALQPPFQHRFRRPAEHQGQRRWF
jgi:hypothetical protein